MNKNLMKRPECKEGSTQTNLVAQIRQYHNQVLSLNKTIADVGREQIRAAYRCGELLARQRMKCPTNGWGKWCKMNLPDMSKSTIGRYISLTEVSDLTHLERNYRTLNAAYVGEGITSAPRQRITITAIDTASPSAGAEVKPTVAHRSNGRGNNGGGKVDSARSNGDENVAVDLKAKLKGGGNLGDLLNKVSPKARAEIESQLQKSPPNDGKGATATYATPAPDAQIEIGENEETTNEAPLAPEAAKDPLARASIAKLTEAIIAKCKHESKPHQKLKDLLKWAFDAVPDRVLSEWLREYCTTAEMVDAIELILDDVKDMPEFLQRHMESLEPLVEAYSAYREQQKCRGTKQTKSARADNAALAA